MCIRDSYYPLTHVIAKEIEDRDDIIKSEMARLEISRETILQVIIKTAEDGIGKGLILNKNYYCS